VSTPRVLGVPPGVTKTVVQTDRGPFAALQAVPGHATYGSVVLVPGWTGSKEDFTAVLRPIADKGIAALAYDQRGQFETPAGSRGYALEELATDLEVVAASMPSPVHLLGHSFGGLVVQHAVLAKPTAYASATLLCSGPGPQPAWKHGLLRLMADSISAYGLAPTWATKRAYDASQPGYLPPPADVAAFVERRFLTNAPESLREMTLHLIEAPDVIDKLAATGTPILVAYGETDDGWPTAIQAAMAKRLHATLAVIAGTGHSPAVEDPAATAAVLTRFWTAQRRNG
jgi:pimeloyl-ACP methyl ester carboxylesterase